MGCGMATDGASLLCPPMPLLPRNSLQAQSRPLTPTWFSDRSPSITPAQSALIVAALKHPSIRLLNQDGWVETDPKQYDLQANPRAFGWTLKVQSLLPWLQNQSPVFNLDLRRSHIIDALNAAYAKHENVAGARRLCGVGRAGPAAHAWSHPTMTRAY